MPTDTDVRDAWLTLAQYNEDNGRGHLAAQQRAQAAEFEPKPEYPDGTVAWVTRSDGVKHFAQRIDGDWVDMRFKDGTASYAVADGQVAKVEPLRVLGDQHVAVPVVTLRTDMCRAATEDYTPGSPVAAVLNAYAEAVDEADSEAGDQ